MNWEEIRQVHADAAAQLIATAERIGAEKWMKPRAEGKWSPAEIVEHLNLAYGTLLNELASGKGMQVRTKLWQRILLRFTLVPKLLRGEPFPANARAPREMRPAGANPDPVSAIATFRERAAQLESTVAEVIAKRQRRKLTHAYFGRAPVAEGVLLCARHVQHHRKQLEQI